MKIILTESQLRDVARAMIKEAIQMPSPESLKVSSPSQKYYYQCYDTHVIDKILDKNGWELANLIEDNENSFTYYIIPLEGGNPTPFSSLLREINKALNDVSDAPLSVSEGDRKYSEEETNGIHSIKVERSEEYKNQFKNIEI